MKIGNMEGTKEEINGFIEDHGLKASDLLQLPTPEPQIRNIWVVVVCGLFVITSIVLHFIGNTNVFYIPTMIVSIVIGACASIVIHLKYRNWGVTSISIITMLGIIAICSRIQSVKEVFEYWRSQPSKK